LTPTSVIGRAIKTDATRRPVSGPLSRLRYGRRCSVDRHGSGFSLLEVLVVVFIIGILATMFTLSVGVTGGDRQLDTEVNRLIAVIRLANEEALIRGREIGMRITSDGYRFATYQEDFVDYPGPDATDQSDWIPIETDLLGPRRLPKGLLFVLRIDGREIVLKSAADESAESALDQELKSAEADADESGADDASDDKSRSDFEPQIIIFSSGDMDPFVIQVRRDFANSGPTVEFDIDGSVEVNEDDS
jgi:general secretion pathway protein H